MKSLFLFCICTLFFCSMQAQKTKLLTEEEANQVMIDMGIRNLPGLFYDHYYRFPNNAQEFYDFISNHYDFKNDTDWKPFIEYLRDEKDSLNIIAQEGVFLITYGSKLLSYSKDDICSSIALHMPKEKYINH
ncbi:hypothetical protein [Bacteroides sp. 519]|uniref:hypothetical protein n=1 Tax=Bacteroides sp. 519 TaxID=2302937 RepID=UPI0013D0FB66|nr:hypothetical protein [Bacteroides sp. 519]NDV59051.1 hypothetical protein [Bacteroides sp. 519]